MAIRIRTNGMDVARVLMDWAKKCPRSTLRGCDIWARKTAGQVKTVAPHTKIGQLKKSIRGRGMMMGKRPVAVVLAPVRHAIFVEFGTKPHGINPRRRQALAFISKGRGKVIIGPRIRTGKNKGRWLVRGSAQTGLSTVRKFAVNHPGTRPNPFFFPTVRRELPKLSNHIWAAWSATLAKARQPRR